MLAGVLQTRHNDVTGALQRRHRGVTGALQGPACKEQEQLQGCVEYRRLLLCPVSGIYHWPNAGIAWLHKLPLTLAGHVNWGTQPPLWQMHL